MVVGRAVLVLAFLVPHQLEGPVGDDLVGVHVDRGSGAALHHVHGELVEESAFRNLLAGRADGIGDLRVQHAEFLVGQGCGPFDVCYGFHILRIVVHVGVGDLVVLDGPLGL